MIKEIRKLRMMKYLNILKYVVYEKKARVRATL